MEALYTAIASSIGGRSGHVKTSDGVINFDLSLPKTLGGTEKAGTTNPEQLFASGYAACFGSAVDFVAKQMKHHLKEINVTAEVTLGKQEDGFVLAAVLKVKLPDVKLSVAQEIVDAAHQVCPYSRATRGNIDVKVIAVE
jgi:Ohr subfamily peroxiredoxin